MSRTNKPNWWEEERLLLTIVSQMPWLKAISRIPLYGLDWLRSIRKTKKVKSIKLINSLRLTLTSTLNSWTSTLIVQFPTKTKRFLRPTCQWRSVTRRTRPRSWVSYSWWTVPTAFASLSKTLATSVCFAHTSLKSSRTSSERDCLLSSARKSRRYWPTLWRHSLTNTRITWSISSERFSHLSSASWTCSRIRSWGSTWIDIWKSTRN